MATERRDSAQRCSRCERVTLGTLPVWLHEGRALVDVVRLCTRCRGEVKPQLQRIMRTAAPSGLSVWAESNG